MKKRIISFVLSVALILGVFSYNAFALNTEAIDKIKNTDEYACSLTYYSAEIGYEQDMKIYLKDGKTAIEAKVPIEDYGLLLKFRVVIKDGKGKLFLPIFPFVCIGFDAEEVMGNINFVDDVLFIADYQLTADGKTYDVLVYGDEDGNTFKCFIFEGELKRIESLDADGSIISEIRINKASYEVSEREFFAPFFAINFDDYNYDFSELLSF